MNIFEKWARSRRARGRKELPRHLRAFREYNRNVAAQKPQATVKPKLQQNKRRKKKYRKKKSWQGKPRRPHVQRIPRTKPIPTPLMESISKGIRTPYGMAGSAAALAALGYALNDLRQNDLSQYGM